MAVLDAEPTTAVSVADNIKHVWNVAVDVIAGGSLLRSLVAHVVTFTKRVTKAKKN